MTQAIDSSDRIRVPISSPRPSRREESRCASGRRPTRIEMKVMLSTPRNDFKRHEGRQRYPRVRIGDPIEHESLPFKARTRIADLACDATVLR